MNHTKELIEMAHGGDKAAREKLIVENMGLIWSIVKRFAGRGYEQETIIKREMEYFRNQSGMRL